MSIEETAEFTPRWNADGLIPAIVQDVETGEVLMLAWMSRQALDKSIETGQTHFWSRSRGALWHKGATSGNVQEIVRILTDCDQDALLVLVRQKGGGACHTGRRSCFYRRLEDGSLVPSPD